MAGKHRDGDAGFAAAMAENERALLHYAGRLLGDRDKAADAVQEVFYRLCRSRRRRPKRGPFGPGGDHVRTWLFTVCRNIAFDIRRKEKRMAPWDDTLAASRGSAAPGPAATAERRETVGRALRELDALPNNQQEVIRLKFANGFSYRQIAGITGLSISNVGVLIHTAIKTLRRRLGAQPGPAAGLEGAAP